MLTSDSMFTKKPSPWQLLTGSGDTIFNSDLGSGTAGLNSAFFGSDPADKAVDRRRFPSISRQRASVRSTEAGFPRGDLGRRLSHQRYIAIPASLGAEGEQLISGSEVIVCLRALTITTP
jgi:hypothetical protein